MTDFAAVNMYGLEENSALPNTFDRSNVASFDSIIELLMPVVLVELDIEEM